MPTTLKTIPKGWEKVNLGVACNFERGIEPGADAYNSDGIGERFLRVADITESRNNPVYVDIRTTKKLKEGDIALTLDGTVGAVKTGLNGIYSTGIRKVSFRNGVNSSRLLYYILQSNAIQRIIDVYASGSTIKHASSAIPHLFTVIPNSSGERNKIAEILSTIDGAIEKTDALIEKYKRMKTGMMQDLFHYGIDDKGKIRSEKTHKFKNSPLGRIPAEWDIEFLDILGQRGSGHTPSKSHPEYWNGGIKWVSLADTNKLDDLYIHDTEQQISKEGIKHSSAVLHPAGTVIVSRDAAVGKSAILSEPMAVSQHFIVWRCGERLNNYFLYYWLQNDKRAFETIALGSTIVTIGLSFFKNYQIRFPKYIAEQKKIAEVLVGIDNLINKEIDHLKKVEEIKAGLMEDLLTGAVRVNHLVNK